MGVAIGIDLGTTNTCAAVATPEGVEFVLGPNSERVHPSVVALPAQGGIVVGADAKLFRLTEPDRVIYSAKRFIGQNIRAPLVQLAMTGIPYALGEGKNQQVVANVGNRLLTMTEISAHVLRHIRERACKQLGTTVDKAVITVPANFTDAQRQATKEAGRLAGLDVMRLINEPTAAALAYGFGQRLDEHALVFDFGGGTLDISVLRLAGEVVEVISSDGDFFLGGDDFDRSLTEFLAAECNRALRIDPRPHAHLMAKLSMGAEAIKCHLSENSSAEGDIDDLELAGRAFRLPFKIARRQFETMISGYLERAMVLTKQTLSAAHLTPHDIGNILCVGGSTRIPAVRNALAELFGRQPDISINPDEVVAQGAAIQAGTLSGILHAAPAPAPAAAPTRNTQVAPLALGAVPISGTVPRPLLLDVNPSTLSVQTAGGFVDNLLDKNSPIPIERTRMFSTVRDGQTRVEIDCCRGEGKRYADNEPLGKLLLEGIPERERGKTRIEVTFRVDADGILQVRARDADSGVEQRAKLSVLGAPE